MRTYYTTCFRRRLKDSLVLHAVLSDCNALHRPKALRILPPPLPSSSMIMIRSKLQSIRDWEDEKSQDTYFAWQVKKIAGNADLLPFKFVYFVSQHFCVHMHYAPGAFITCIAYNCCYSISLHTCLHLHEDVYLNFFLLLGYLAESR